MKTVVETVAFILLIVAFLAGLVLIPLGLPGLWLMVLAVIGYAALVGFEQVGWTTIGAVIVLAVIAEAAEAWLGFRITRRYGRSNRAGWGALLGGLAGALAGTPIPIIGNVIGAFLGSFLGAVLLAQSPDSDIRLTLGAGWGAVLGRAAGAAVKIAVGLGIATIGVFAAL